MLLTYWPKTHVQFRSAEHIKGKRSNNLYPRAANLDRCWNCRAFMSEIDPSKAQLYKLGEVRNGDIAVGRCVAC
jgi:hypothetical protein